MVGFVGDADTVDDFREKGGRGGSNPQIDRVGKLEVLELTLSN